MIHVGTCGFSYKNWVGPFYPRGTDASAMLGLYARRFDAVEIDSTYYAIPRPATFAAMAHRTPPAFRFCVKAPGTVTHLPVDADPSPDDIDAFRECLAPLAQAGKLAAILAQFPYSFAPGAGAYRRLAAIRDGLPASPIVAEFRRRDWQTTTALRRLHELGIGWCNVDEPRLAALMRPSAVATSDVGYVRFHGRNAAKWWKQDRSADERYDYLYSEDELAAWLPRIDEVAEKTRETFVFFNNHRNGQAAMNARQMARMLGVMRSGPDDAPGEAPDAGGQLPLLGG